MHTLSRRGCLALGAGFAASMISGRANASGVPDVVVELFSSQGCSSCPPADRLLTELKDKPGVLAISHHVDYWDYLGWKDTLGGPEYSQRQYDYAKARGDMDVYTPQMIVNGGKPMVGSQRSEVHAVLEQSRQAKWPVALSMADNGKEIVIDCGSFTGEGEPATEATLWLMPILGEARIKIERGEIAGREITYNNVARKLVPAAMWTGKASRLGLPKDSLMPPDCTSCVALLQEGKLGRVLGAARLDVLAS